MSFDIAWPYAIEPNRSISSNSHNQIIYSFQYFFRFGHSQINSLLCRLNEHGSAISEGHLPMRDAFFAPERIIYEGGIDPIIRGSLAQPAQQVDAKVDIRLYKVYKKLNI